jgi:hypothetical protein
MSDVHPVGTVEEEGFSAAAPYKTEALLRTVDGAREAEGVID